MGPEQRKLADRLFNHPTKKCVNFHFTPGPNATPESVCREINRALDQIERGEAEIIEDFGKDERNGS